LPLRFDAPIVVFFVLVVGPHVLRLLLIVEGDNIAEL
jgi:hypothetical protein